MNKDDNINVNNNNNNDNPIITGGKFKSSSLSPQDRPEVKRGSLNQGDNKAGKEAFQRDISHDELLSQLYFCLLRHRRKYK